MFGCFFVVNLAIGVVFASFTRVSEMESNAMRLAKKDATSGDGKVTEGADGGGCGVHCSSAVEDCWEDRPCGGDQ